jgi:DNA (cytosine-5)-methyltransferase 1
MNELALFAGAGGGILGGHLLGWRTVCAVEWEPYAASVLAARQNDGLFPPFPIWDDVQSFDGRPWRGSVDVVSGGFPCQDISVAGKGAGIDGARSGMWGHMARIVGEVRPRYVFVENSPALLTRGLGRVLGDLAALGYDCRWTVLGAADVGAPHQRDRFWLVARRSEDVSHVEHERAGWGEQQPEGFGEKSRVADAASGEPWQSPERKGRQSAGRGGGDCGRTEAARGEDVAHADNHARHYERSRREGVGSEGERGSAHGSAFVAHAESQRKRSGPQSRWDDGRGKQLEGAGPWGDAYDCGFEMDYTHGAQRQGNECSQRERPEHADIGGAGWWATEPDVGRVAHGVAARVDRLKAIGNGQVPLCAATAFKLLTETA